MPQFLFLIRDYEPSSKQYTPEELQQVIQKYSAWARRLREQNKLVAADKLADDGGWIVRRRDGQLVVDGPFTEAKEAIGGFFIIEAADYSEAARIAQECPIFETGGEVELHAIEG